MNKQILTFIIFISVLTFSSCKKCKQCYLEETDTDDGSVVTTSIGEVCGAKLKKLDGAGYQGSDGPVVVHCKK